MECQHRPALLCMYKLPQFTSQFLRVGPSEGHKALGVEFESLSLPLHEAISYFNALALR